MNQDQTEPETTDDQRAQTKQQRKSYLGLDYARINAVGTNIPGFQAVKNNVIKPLMVATEKVVEYYFAESSTTAPQQLPPTSIDGQSHSEQEQQ